MFKKNDIKLHTNIQKLNIYWFFHNLIFAYVIERLFGLERGLNVQQMIYIEIIYAVVMVILEIPTGVLADKWSRKNAMIISSIFTFFEIFILIFAHDFIFFALSAVSAAIAGSLASGTSNALLYDSLKLNGQEQDFEKVNGKINFYSSVSAAFAALFGGFMAQKLGYGSTYLFSLISVSIALFISFTLQEPDLKSGELEDDISVFNFKNAIEFLKTNSSVRFIMLYATIIGTVINYIYEYWQIYLNDINIPLSGFGPYSVLCSAIVSITGIFAYKIKNIFNYRIIFSICILFIGLEIVLTGLIHSAIGIITLLTAFIFFGITEPLTVGYIHHRTDSVHRATVESFYSFILRVVTIITGLFFGYITSNFSIFSGFGFLGLIVIGYSIYYLIFQFKYIE